MAIDLKGRSFLTLLDYKEEEIRYLLDLAKLYKTAKFLEKPHKLLENKNIVILFEKDSTRTRCAFEVAAMDLGIGVTYIGPSGSQMGKKESIRDTARVLGRLYDGIEYRGFSQEIVNELSEFSKVPVWNGLTDEFHPTQVLADLLTIEEKIGRLKGVNFVYMGDARNNVANSLMIGCAKMGLNFTACAPKDLFPPKDLVDKCREIGKESGSIITLTDDIYLGSKNADVIYTDVWVSMGEPDEVWKERINKLKRYQVNVEVMENAKENAIFMHCLPAFHDLNTKVGKEIYEKFGISEMEVTNEVFESENSVVFDEAENRMHTIKALILATLGV
ncbi:ornithine carbamoyltransferase [[Clostridium] sordellii]|uniref:Ornithine carbamoyltransferase n=1 Tax=Paraclostridium sordellii TaxID=1505 RepID=A0ABP1XNM1_PARSO|nr:ornithine carbamoyltransferase [Paeniclostridium sordellii]CEJ72831.1 Ornithine carbamoyltransferase (OTCase) [[Clostridium] sordellii] [Paeniclostridium sordellii]CEK30838.1 ornithine carbamoyltransferase [[Clostridium] sordellii] [Paeniclostridium sordellii]CEN68384.1 ornithine carbamoyltransferase [[Clostridium] sordellii] [Paeniclostridium sordellii]CEN71651.1 ornithine carbamoyltransferase [[Clostridium] sordellii] [Paeniclostridium sordellii]CEO22018.1 ornithine carbamoyltransferase [